MRFNTDELQQVVTELANVIGTTHIVPTLRNIKLVCDGKSATMFVFNGSTSVRRAVTLVEPCEEEVCLIPLIRIAPIVKLANSDYIDIFVSGTTAQIHDGLARYCVSLGDIDEYPEIDPMGEVVATFRADILKDAIKGAITCARDIGVASALQGVLLELLPEDTRTWKVVASDGRHMVVISVDDFGEFVKATDLDTATAGFRKILLPATLAKQLVITELGEFVSVGFISKNKNNIICAKSDLVEIQNLTYADSHEYPSWANVFSNVEPSATCSITVEVAELLRLLKKANATTDINQTCNFIVTDGSLVISSGNAEATYEEAIPLLAKSGDNCQINILLCITYLVDIIKLIGGSVTIKYAPGDPSVIVLTSCDETIKGLIAVRKR